MRRGQPLFHDKRSPGIVVTAPAAGTVAAIHRGERRALVSVEIEQKMGAAVESHFLLDMFSLEKSLVYYVSSINSNGTVIDKLKLNAAKIGFTPEEVEYLDDIIIENSQCNKQAEIYSNILASLMDARVSVVSNNLNVLIKFLTLTFFVNYDNYLISQVF